MPSSERAAGRWQVERGVASGATCGRFATGVDAGVAFGTTAITGFEGCGVGVGSVAGEGLPGPPEGAPGPLAGGALEPGPTDGMVATGAGMTIWSYGRLTHGADAESNPRQHQIRDPQRENETRALSSRKADGGTPLSGMQSLPTRLEW